MNVSKSKEIALPSKPIFCCTNTGQHIPSISRFAFLCMFFFFFFHFQSVVEGSISAINSGKTFHSKQDRNVGLQLVRGYEYMGRLQHVDENPTLCSGEHPFQKFNIVPSSDGLPVAIIAQTGGGCSASEKASIAARMISPKNQVQYLIIQDSSKGGNRKLGEYYEDDMNQQYLSLSSTSRHDDFFFNTLFGTDDTFDYNEKDVQVFTDDDSNDSYYNNDINIAVLHVSYDDGQALLNMINSEDPQVFKNGGMRVLLNSRELNVNGRTVMIWILITVTVCACFCCCILAVVQSSFEEEVQQPPPTRTPARRRLTLEQVRSKFPAFHFNPKEHHQNYCAPKSSDTNINDFDETELQQNRFCQLSDECTICLDEFIPGVRCRQLPCEHVFHSTCIARWLIERSATCPLCKLDLYEEEVVEDENSDGTSQLELDSGNQQSAQGDTVVDANNGNMRRSALSSRFWSGWTMNLFGHIRQQQQRPSATDMLTELTEPLVSSVEQRVEAHQQLGLITTSEEEESDERSEEANNSPLNSTTSIEVLEL